MRTKTRILLVGLITGIMFVATVSTALGFHCVNPNKAEGGR